MMSKRLRHQAQVARRAQGESLQPVQLYSMACTHAGLHAHRSAGLLKRSLRVLMSFTIAALLMSVAAAPCHLRGSPRCQGLPMTKS